MNHSATNIATSRLCGGGAEPRHTRAPIRKLECQLAITGVGVEKLHFQKTGRKNFALGSAPPSGYLFGGFGQSTDTIGDYNGAPGIGPGEPFNMQLALKLIF